MHQHHVAGEKLFVDYSGLTVPIWETNLQSIAFHAEIFVSVLGASDLIFCVATKTQQLEDWIVAHTNMFDYYGGVPQLLVPDNLRSAVTKADRYEPSCNRTYEDMAEHYGCAIMPARAYKPKDKAKAEKSVQFIQQRIIAPLRNEKYITLSQLNQAITDQLIILNNRSFQKLPYSRRELFERVERSALQPLPATHYQFARWFKETVNGSYHVCVYQHHYSVPYDYVRKSIDIRVTHKTVECFYREKSVARHLRDNTPSTYTTIDGHRPEAHRQHALWNEERLQAWACQIGPGTHALIRKLFENTKRHLHQKERSALGILRLSHQYDEQTLEYACQQALLLETCGYSSVHALIKRYRTKIKNTNDQAYETPAHGNVRGPDYYH